MALTGAQKVQVAEIVLETYQTVDSRAGSLNSEQEVSIIEDLATWFDGESPLRNRHVRVKGGSSGADLDNDRKREAIRRRIRKALGLSLFSDEVHDSSIALPTIPVF